MSLFVLDTDILSLLMDGHPVVSDWVRQVSRAEIAITVISVEEQLTGWYGYLRRARRPGQLAFAYERLARTVEFLGGLTILTFPEPAIERFEELRRARLRIASQDLRIAAIVLENDATLVTRNVRDFQRIPNLRLVNWAA